MASSERLRLKMQRDLNCIADADKGTRRAGLKRLLAALQDQKTGAAVDLGQSPESVALFFSRHLMMPLLSLFEDEVEFCRENAVKLILMFANSVLPAASADAAIAVLARRAASVVAARVGSSPVVEQTEEVRLLLVQLVTCLLNQPAALPALEGTLVLSDEERDEMRIVGGSSSSSSSSSSSMAITMVDGSNGGDLDVDSAPHGAAVCAVISRSLQDSFPEVKRECCTAVRALVKSSPRLACAHGEALMKNLVANLGHQHSKTRQLTLQALGQLVVSCAGPASGAPVPALDGGGSSGSGASAATSSSSGRKANGDDDDDDDDAVVATADLAEALRKSLVSTVFPALSKAVHDRSPTVRFTLCRCLGFLLRARPEKTTGLATLGLEKEALLDLLALTMDQADDVQKGAHEALVAAGKHWAARAKASASATMPLAPSSSASSSSSSSSSSLPPSNPTGRDEGAFLAAHQSKAPPPTLGTFTTSPDVQPVELASHACGDTRAMVAFHTPQLVPALLETFSHWTVHGRKRALDTLAQVIRLNRGATTAAGGAGVASGEAAGLWPESILADFLPKIVEGLAARLPDDEEEVADAAAFCARSLGDSAAAEMALALALPRARGEGAGMDTAQNRSAGLLLVAALVDGQGGCSKEVVAAQAGAVAATLASAGVVLQGWEGMVDLSSSSSSSLSSSSSSAGAKDGKALMDADLADALLLCAEALVSRFSSEAGCLGGTVSLADVANSDFVVKQLLRCLCQLIACPGESVTEGLADDARDIVETIAKAAAASSSSSSSSSPASSSPSSSDTEALVDALYVKHMDGLLTMIYRPSATESPEAHAAADAELKALEAQGSSAVAWQGNSDPARRAFDAMLREAAAVCGPCLERILPAIIQHTAAEKEPDLKLSMLCLLEVLLGRPESKAHWPAFSVALIKQALERNLIWRAGRVASTVRKVAVACFYSLLHRGYADQACLFQTAPALLPILKTDLDDYDASTRQLVCLSLDYMFRALPGALGNQPVAELYPSLLKRLDDSSDDVRYAVCKAFKSFFGSAPVTAFRGTCIDYTLDQLFVHLDDMDEGIQSKVFEVIIAALPIDAPKVIKKANSMRNAHRSPHYIDQIVAAASGR